MDNRVMAQGPRVITPTPNQPPSGREDNPTSTKQAIQPPFCREDIRPSQALQPPLRRTIVGARRAVPEPHNLKKSRSSKPSPKPNRPVGATGP